MRLPFNSKSDSELSLFDSKVDTPKLTCATSLKRSREREEAGGVFVRSSSSTALLSSLELSDTKVYGPELRALLGTAAQSCKVVVRSRLSEAGAVMGPSEGDPLADQIWR